MQGWSSGVIQHASHCPRHLVRLTKPMQQHNPAREAVLSSLQGSPLGPKFRGVEAALIAEASRAMAINGATGHHSHHVSRHLGSFKGWMTQPKRLQFSITDLGNEDYARYRYTIGISSLGKKGISKKHLVYHGRQ